MLQITKKYLGITLVALVMVFMSLYLPVTLNTDAQEENRNETLESMLESLKARVEAEPDFLFNVRFAIPLMENDEVWWHVPYNSEDGEVVRILGEIGKDYVCFFELAGSAPINRCTPYSNIVSITYLGDL